jgi:hypothetical protein
MRGKFLIDLAVDACPTKDVDDARGQTHAGSYSVV